MSEMDLAARAPFNEAASGFFRPWPSADERSAKKRASGFAKPAIARSAHL
jgi:hypothetical protein